MSEKETSAVVRRYGIAEWYGKNYASLTANERLELLAAKKLPCPFQSRPGKEVLCSKRGGVCSLRLYEMDKESGKVKAVSCAASSVATTCPARFLEDDLIFQLIGEELVNSSSPLLQGEVPYLVPVLTEGDFERERFALHEDPLLRQASFVDSLSSEDIEPYGTEIAPPTPSKKRRSSGSGKGVGVIDYVLVNPSDYSKWCALELQAVYFSGAGMDKDYSAIRKTKEGIPFPGGNRRPDYRSSGPKRLMPQLQIKVPSLRRWGKKLAVLVDKGFWFSLGRMERAGHVSNSDIVWFVVDYVEKDGKLSLVHHTTNVTTLEDAIDGLTAGKPVSLQEFEKRVRDKLDGPASRPSRPRSRKIALQTFDLDDEEQ